MKKLLLFVAMLALALACAAPPTNDAALDTNRNTNDSEPSLPVMTESAAIAQERAIWETIKNKDHDAFAAMLVSDQVEVTPEGVLDRAGTIASVKDFEPTELTFTDWKFLPINKEAILLTYTVAHRGKYKGEDLPSEPYRASSAWVGRDGKWLAIYHQSTPIRKTPPAPPAKSAAKSEATPASSPNPVTTGDDAIANEKAIWEALKAKNYDGFAGALAADALEIEPTGVYDKAGTLKEIQEIDFSKAELTDFRAVRLGSDANLVIYRVKMPGPDPAEYHSTIWASRDGKWLAVFHQGTPITGAPASTASPTAR